MNVYLIIGEANAGKTTVLRHLFGYWKSSKNGRLSRLATKNKGEINIFLKSFSALQEEKTGPREYIQFIKNHSMKPENVLVPLRIDSINNCGRAVDYVREFEKEGWNIVASVILESKEKEIYPCCPNCKSVKSRLERGCVPTNKVAYEVRNHFNLY